MDQTQGAGHTGLTTYPADPTTGACTTSNGSAVSHSYDAADRLVDAGYGYDAFGRVTSVPASDAGGASLTLDYFANDLAHSITKSGRTRTATLDPALRFRTWSDTGSAGALETNHYIDDGDTPAWVAESADGSHWTRTIAGLDGALAAIEDSATGVQLQLSTLHGDVVATASTDPAASGPTAVFEANEFGIPRDGTPPRFGWLGAKTRETDVLSGLTLMGTRVYSPGIGRFLQVDPVVGGSANAYDYAAQDPLNNLDLDGRNTAYGNCGTSWIQIGRAYTRSFLWVWIGYSVNRPVWFSYWSFRLSISATGWSYRRWGVRFSTARYWQQAFLVDVPRRGLIYGTAYFYTDGWRGGCTSNGPSAYAW